MDKSTDHSQIMRAIGDLEGTMRGVLKSVEGVEEALRKQSIDMEKVQQYQERQKGEQKVLSVLWGSVSAVIVSLVVGIITYSFKK